MTTLIKIIVWAVLLVSGSYLMLHFGFWPGFAIACYVAAAHMIWWIDDKEKGRLR